MPDARGRERVWGGTRSDAYRRGGVLTSLGFAFFLLSRVAGFTDGWMGTAALIIAAVIVVIGAMELWNWRSLPDEPQS